ncbi:putative H/ACA ribonucleoprotein complex subunit 1-like protein 1 [Actinidia eriantha]|uniref:putative H/ACA ribonucleoprotein complex subunit 1-like protein 1 n=1 Tax=Actinidia eriantha TaxID=165200 RepID=UPI0025888C9D|nr:putative H/ACA ribonucleoprotein complex subunit 1-like protein 1 [Actinidia eriantha]
MSEVSTFLHAWEEEAVTKLTNEKVPYLNAPIYLQNMTQMGRVDEIFGPVSEPFMSFRCVTCVVCFSYSAGDKFYMDPAKLLLLSRILPQPQGHKQAARGGFRGGRGGARGGGRGGGGFRVRGGPRGGGRGCPRGGGGGFRGTGRW